MSWLQCWWKEQEAGPAKWPHAGLGAEGQGSSRGRGRPKVASKPEPVWERQEANAGEPTWKRPVPTAGAAARNGSQTPSHGADGTGVSAGVTAGQAQARGRGEQPQTPRTGLHWGGRLAQKEDIQKEDLFIFWTSQEMRRVSRPAWRESRRDGLAPLHGPQPLRDNAGRTVPLLNQAWPALRLGVHPGAEGGSRPKQKNNITLRHCSEEVHRSPKERNWTKRWSLATRQGPNPRSPLGMPTN